MKAHTTAFKEQIKEMGRELDSIITYGDTVLGNEQLNAVTPSFQGAILKSVMKQLDIDSNVEIPIGTNLKYEFGLKVNGEYEYLNFGNYIVKDVEKQEDTGSYKITCYDKMLLSMKDYVKIPITYPITIREYINSLCAFLGLSFANINDNFVNSDKIIPSELYLSYDEEKKEYSSLGYTFRDVFDELAQVTASTICINGNDEVEIRYINNTGDTIDEEYLKDINVNFGEKHGPINSIVLSRSGQSDNVFLRDETSIANNGLCELKITDNQIMNFNNRSDFLPDILGKLNGLEYYLNDFSSTGICYYDLCDRYNVKVGEITYSCVMFNDELLVTQGLQENIYTEAPEQTETDYTKADKTDRRINQTYIIVDKQNQQIEAVVSQTDEQNEKIARVTQTVDELNSKISDIADITISAEDNDAQVELNNINQSEPIRIVIRPIGESISYLYPSNNLFPSDTLYLKNRKIRFTNTKTEEIFDYELPTDLLYYDSENYDEFILDYDAQNCVVNKKVGYNADGTTYILDKPTTLEFQYPTGNKAINLTDGDYKINVLGYDTAYLFVRLMAQNIYTTQFATKAEVNSKISQTAQDITLNVNKKLENYSTTTEMNAQIQLTAGSITNSVNETLENYSTTSQMNSAIQQTANSITSNVSETYETKTNASNKYATKNELGNTEIKLNSKIEQTAEGINSVVSKKIGSNEVVSSINQSAEEIELNSNRLIVNSDNFKLTKEGDLTCSNATITGGTISVPEGVNGIETYITQNDGDIYKTRMKAGGVSCFKNDTLYARLHDGATNSGGSLQLYNADGNSGVSLFATESTKGGYLRLYDSSGTDNIYMSGPLGSIRCITLNQTSLEGNKKNFQKFNGALDIINDIDLYKYNLKVENDDAKKHIGFVIGKDYNYSSEITAVDEIGKEIGVDLYSMTSLCLQAIKEQQEIINQLKEEIKMLKESEKKWH